MRSRIDIFAVYRDSSGDYWFRYRDGITMAPEMTPEYFIHFMSTYLLTPGICEDAMRLWDFADYMLWHRDNVYASPAPARKLIELTLTRAS